MAKEMIAGREMDALIAEHVFKWRKMHGPKADYDGPCESYDVLIPPGVSDPFPFYPSRGSIKPWFFCRKWSTDIADAWEVAGRLTKIQCGDDFYAFEITKKHYGWWVRVKHPLWMGIHNELGKNYEMYQAHADTAPLAICRCALKVAGVKINGDS